MTYTMLSAWGSDVARHAVVLRSDGARFRVSRYTGFAGPDVRRLVLDAYTGHVVECPVSAWDSEYRPVVGATAGATGLPGTRVTGEVAIDDTRSSR